jgi:hypothetical protein
MLGNKTGCRLSLLSMVGKRSGDIPVAGMSGTGMSPLRYREIKPNHRDRIVLLMQRFLSVGRACMIINVK